MSSQEAKKRKPRDEDRVGKEEAKNKKEKSRQGRKRNAAAAKLSDIAPALNEKTLMMREEIVHFERGYYGENHRYPKRIRIPPLIGWANERVEATYDRDGNPTIKIIRVDLDAMRNEESRVIRNNPTKKQKVSTKEPPAAKDEKRIQIPVIKIIPPPKENKKVSRGKQDFAARFDDFLDLLSSLNIGYEVISEGSTSTSVLINLKPGAEFPEEKSRLNMQFNVVGCQDNKAKAVVNDKEYALRFNSTLDVPAGAMYSFDNESKRVNLEIMCIAKKI